MGIRSRKGGREEGETDEGDCKGIWGAEGRAGGGEEGCAEVERKLIAWISDREREGWDELRFYEFDDQTQRWDELMA